MAQSVLISPYDVSYPMQTEMALSLDAHRSGLDTSEESNNNFKSTAAVKLQKVYRSYRTRRRLADSVVVAEELWWQAIDYVRLNHSTVSFFSSDKPETAASRWCRISLNASKVGKGLGKDSKAQKLAFQHWIEAIDPRHRYGHNLNLYYEEWCKADARQPFFYWLDIGDGRDIDLKDCPRTRLHQERIQYLGPQERELYEYIIAEGMVVHKQSGKLLDTDQGLEGSKWIFVINTCKKLYAGKKKKGAFHHSSFLAGGATMAAGSLTAENGKLKSVSAYSGHYRPTNENLGSFLAFLKENGINLNEIQVLTPEEDSGNYESSELAQIKSSFRWPMDHKPPKHHALCKINNYQPPRTCSYKRALSGSIQSPKPNSVTKKEILQRIKFKKEASSYQLGHQLSLKWSTGAGPRICCVADYPSKLRKQAITFLDLSPNEDLHQPSAHELPGFLLSLKDFCRIM